MATHTGSGSLNVNSESGQQRNYTMTGGDHNTQYNADNISMGGMRFDNIQASGNSRQHVGNAYYYNAPLQYHGVQTKPKGDPVHANFIRACTEGRISRLNHLRSKGADIDHRDERDATPLHHAAYCGHVEIVRYLLDAGADTDACGKWVGTPLSLASVKGHLPVVELLLKNKADVNQECGYLGSAMHMAYSAGAMDIVKASEKNGGSPGLKQRAVCDRAFLRGLSSAETTSLSMSCAYRPAARVSFASCSPGVIATRRRQLETVRYCLAVEHRFSARELFSLGHLNTVTDRIENPTEQVTTVMAMASTFDSTMLTLLLANGANPRARDSKQSTAMMWLGNCEPLDEAPSSEEISKFVSILREGGIDINSQTRNGFTPLMEAMDSDFSIELAKTLFDQGASANIVNKFGWTALMCAVHSERKSRKQFVELLCERGAFVNLKNLDGDTAMDIARRELRPDDFKAVREVLLRFGATEDVQKRFNTRPPIELSGIIGYRADEFK